MTSKFESREDIGEFIYRNLIVCQIPSIVIVQL